VQGEDGLRNRDAKAKANRSCDFWLVFENGVRLNVEMQDHQEPDMEMIPRADMPKWLKSKLALESKQDADLEEHSEDGEHAKKEVTITEAMGGQGSLQTIHTDANLSVSVAEIGGSNKGSPRGGASGGPSDKGSAAKAKEHS